MIGKIIDMDRTDAFITFEDGTTMDISLSRLPTPIKIGETVDIPIKRSPLQNDRMNNFF
ncbi:MAG: hypothetical protein H7Y18_17990 [Clostridiaceae bacterium]|nr:hypothetical protein [Clostridiaceae bacterium]